MVTDGIGFSGHKMLRLLGIVLPGIALSMIGELSCADSLGALSTNWPQVNLRASLEPAGTIQVQQGGKLQVRVAADNDADVLLVLVTSDSKARVFVPHRERTEDRVSPGTEMMIPDLLSGETLYANMPVGAASVYVIASSEALMPSTAGSDPAKWVPLSEIQDRLGTAVKSGHDIRMAVTRLPVGIASPSIGEFVSTEDFVQFYGVGTRGLNGAERGFAVQFVFNSADLTDWGRRQLDAVGNGMKDLRLASDRFMIEGHTDDVGTDEYNLRLSERRAQAVAQYLSGLGVNRGRLKEAGVGKAGPSASGSTEQARAANRRVVIRRLDGAH
jgi:OmpA family/Domain of unknown function (DUF4384)